MPKSCRKYNSKKYEEKKKVLELGHEYLSIRRDGSKITDPWEIVDDRKHHAFDKRGKEKSVKGFVIYGSK